ncbi:hypothetical protein [Dysgonomonas termitidis]|uniref:Plantaricin C family lantibiotic n=1 Tax=Dysgonomonas termitidis TaxID=1516126 RepID=A0ABV9L0U8_9BACT
MKPEKLKKEEEQVNLENDIIGEIEADALKGGKTAIVQDSVSRDTDGISACCNPT